LFQFLIALFVEAIQFGSAVGNLFLFLAGFGQEIVAQDFFSEVPGVQIDLQDGFIEFLQFAEGEFFGQQLKSDGAVTQFSSDTFQRLFHDLVVVEG